MVNNQVESKSSVNKSPERSQNRQQKPALQSHGSRGQHVVNQPRVQGNYSGAPQNSKEQQTHNQIQANKTQLKNVLQSQRTPQERYEGQGHGRYYRDRNNERAGFARNRAEETVEDIKEDILRLEKEIDLEIKEIKSLKL